MTIVMIFVYILLLLFFFKQKTAYEMRISDWSSDVCSSDLGLTGRAGVFQFFAAFLVDDAHRQADLAARVDLEHLDLDLLPFGKDVGDLFDAFVLDFGDVDEAVLAAHKVHESADIYEVPDLAVINLADLGRSEERRVG